MNHQHAIREEELKNRVASGASVPIFGDAELVSSSGKSEMAWLDMGSADPAQCLRSGGGGEEVLA